jgi:cell cycle checkpoint protein
MLLTGPCGCGKTATIKMVCKELDIDLVEFEPGRAFELSNNEEEVWEESETKLFRRFLRQVEYLSVEKGSNRRRLVLIEQLPNSFYG